MFFGQMSDEKTKKCRKLGTLLRPSTTNAFAVVVVVATITAAATTAAATTTTISTATTTTTKFGDHSYQQRQISRMKAEITAAGDGTAPTMHNDAAKI